MRKLSAILSIVAVMCLVPNAFALDCNTRAHLQYTGWDYAINHLTSSSTECWSPGTLAPAWNSTVGMWEFDDYYQSQIQRVISVPSGDDGSNSWDTLLYVDFYSSCASSQNFFSVSADVNHNGSHTITEQYGINAYTSTSDSGYKVGYFNAVSGDTVTITIYGAMGFSCSGHAYFKDVWIQRAE